MQLTNKFITLTIFSVSLLMYTFVQAEVELEQINSVTKVAYVLDDDWQPEEFVNGTPIPATHLIDAGIKVDGKTDEIQWRNAQEVTVPLFYGDVREVTLKALYTDKEVFFAVRWPDSTNDKDHHPWVWNSSLERYEEGPQIEDSVLLSFEAGCEWTPSLLSGYIYDFDAWHWLAARSDPIGQALDLYGNVQDREIMNVNFGAHERRNPGDHWQMKFIENHNVDMNANWNELNRAYLWQPVADILYVKAIPDGGPNSQPYYELLPPPTGVPSEEDQTYPQYSPIPLTGSAGEVAAKGHWENGYWTVEFRRDLVTPVKHIYDTIFNRMVQFSVHVFDHTDQLTESSESERLFIQFLPQKLMLVEAKP